VHRHFIPHRVLILADSAAGQQFFAAHVEFIKSVAPAKGAATAFVCENFVCQLPVTGSESPGRFARREKWRQAVAWRGPESMRCA